MSPWWLTITGGVTGNYVECLAGMLVTQVESLFCNWLKKINLGHRLDVEQSSPPANFFSSLNCTRETLRVGWSCHSCSICSWCRALCRKVVACWLIGWLDYWLACRFGWWNIMAFVLGLSWCSGWLPKLMLTYIFVCGKKINLVILQMTYCVSMNPYH